MKLIVGLGNPGKQYERTRHNAGFMAIDRLVERHAAGTPAKARFNAAAVETKIGGEACLLLKPTTFMNRSGGAVADAARFYKLDPAKDLFVLVDDVALPCGQIRIRPGGGSGGHNGLADIQRALGSQAYPRCRIGIDATPAFMNQADYVLGRFTEEQLALVLPAIDRAADAAEVFVTKGIDAAMNQFNPKDPPRPRGGQETAPAEHK